MDRPAEHLLRTFAAVPPQARVLDVGCASGRHLIPLAQLGFDVWGLDRDAQCLEALRLRLAEIVPGHPVQLHGADAAQMPYADAHFDWIVAWGILDHYSDAERLDILTELRRVLVPGGWLYVTWSGDADALLSLFNRAAFAVAEAPQFDERERAIRAIFRRVDADTVG